MVALASVWQREALSDGRVIRVLRARPRAEVVVRLLSAQHIHRLESELVPTDRLLERWAVAQGSGYYESWEEQPIRSRPPPLDEETAVVVDRIVMHAPIQTRKFACRWYLRPNEPIKALARALGLHQDCVIMRWRSTLWALRREFLAHALDV